MINLDELKELNEKAWKSYRSWDGHKTRTCYEVGRRLTSEERKLIYKCILDNKLIVQLYTAGNQGVGMRILEPSLGINPQPGMEYTPFDATIIATFWEDHFFDDDPIEYKFRTWCKKHGTHQVDRAYKFFKAFAQVPHNNELMEMYNFKKPFIQPVGYFHY